MLTLRVFLRSLYLAAFALLLFVFAVYAQSGDTSPTDLHKVLTALATGGTAAAVAVLFSWLANNVAAFNALPSVSKFALQGVVSLVLGI